MGPYLRTVVKGMTSAFLNKPSLPNLQPAVQQTQAERARAIQAEWGTADRPRLGRGDDVHHLPPAFRPAMASKALGKQPAC